MSEFRRIECPQCGATENDDEFVGSMNVTIEKAFRITGHDGSGRVTGYWLDETYPDHMPKTFRIECESCGLSWTSRVPLRVTS